MIIDQRGLNNMLYIVKPRNGLDSLKKKRAELLNKFFQGISNSNENARSCNENTIKELQSVEKNIQQAIFEEKSLKLKLERMKIEEKAVKKLRKREILLAKHEAVLYNASYRKLFSALGKASRLRIMIRDGATLSLRGGYAENRNCEHKKDELSEEVDEIKRDLKEAAEYRKAADIVARRRRNTRMKETAEKKAAERRNRRSNSVNITV